MVTLPTGGRADFGHRHLPQISGSAMDTLSK